MCHVTCPMLCLSAMWDGLDLAYVPHGIIGIWGCSWCFWKALSELDLILFIAQFSELRYKRY